MLREMPKHYWKNLPEARDIGGLVAAAGNRAGAMVEAAPTEARKRAGVAAAQIQPETPTPAVVRVIDRGASPETLAELNAALRGCRACPLWRPATQVVRCEGGAERPLLALIGEQPGDQEDLAGRPFIGPAGQLLDRTLAEAGIDRASIYLTNAVKHFQFEPRGKRRIHSKPGAGEVEACRWWVKHELALVQPALVLALGATALGSLSGYRGSLRAVRGSSMQTRECQPMTATVHPSYLLRLPEADARAREYEGFVADPRGAHDRARKLAETAK